MAQILEMGIEGLWTNPNPFSDVPPGALGVADEVVIDRPGQADTRRGFAQFNDVIADTDAVYEYQDTLFIHADDTLYVDDGLGAWDALTGVFEPASSDVALRSESMNQNLYLATLAGIQVLDSAAAPSAYSAGMPQGLDGTAEINGGMAGWFPTDSQVAYRIVWGREDSNTNLVLGAPSARILVANSSGSDETVNLEFTVPVDITVSDFYQVYRSFPSAGAAITPDDELQLVFQAHPSAGQITARVVTLTDVATIDQMGAALYTNPSQEGILAANARPPRAVDVVEFNQFMFFANTSREQKVILTIQENYAIGETFEIDALVYTGAAAENIPAQEFEVGATADATLASLIRVINRDTNNTDFYAVPIDAFSFFITGRTVEVAQFTLDGDNVYNKTLPLDSDNSARVNQIDISKFQQPEAAPLGFNLRVGSATKAIKRILKTREALIILKEDGVYRLAGTDVTNFAVDELNTTFVINGANTAVAFDNMVVAMTNQGVVAFDINGYELLSERQLGQTLLQLGQGSTFAELASAVAYNSDRKYLISVPFVADTENREVFVYNLDTKSWTKWLKPFTAGLEAKADGRLYLARPDGQVVRERKDFAYTDYADFEYEVTVVSASGAVISVASVPSGIEVGMTLVQGGFEAEITDITGTDLTVEFDNLPWAAGVATVYEPITSRIAWLENAGGNPGVLKHYKEITFVFRDASFRNLIAGFSTNLSNGTKSVDLEALGGAAPWGIPEWGEFPWGGAPGGFQPIRTYFPKETQRAHWFIASLEVSKAFYSMSLLGASAIASVMSPRFK